MLLRATNITAAAQDLVVLSMGTRPERIKVICALPTQALIRFADRPSSDPQWIPRERICTEVGGRP